MGHPGDRSPARNQQTIRSLIRGRARAFPHRLALVEGDRRLSYENLDRRTERLSAVLRGYGVGKGDRVATAMVNGISTFEIYFAVARIGAIVVPLNWRWAVPELRYAIEFSEPSILFVSERFANLGFQAAPTIPVIVIPDHGELPLDLPDAGRLFDEPAVEAADPWLMLFTSGTTGRPKACLHMNQTQVITATSNAIHLSLAADDRLLLTMPLFHVGGLGTALAHLAVGGAVVIAPRDHDAIILRDILVSQSCTTIALDGKMLETIIDLQHTEPLPLVLRRLIRGGGQQSLDACNRLEALLGLRVVLSYGQTESGGQSLYMSSPEQVAGPRAVGRPSLHLEACVADEDGAELPDGVVGELCLRGPTVMIGYWKDESATANAIRDGWLRTGDSFARDADGYFHFAGRIKELIKSGGENVYPAEVEQVLREHPAISDCAVVGVPDPRWSEAVKAIVVATEPLTPAQVATWCEGRIAGYKKPRYVEFVEAIPRTFIGKVDSVAIRSRPLTPDQSVG